MTFWIYNVGLGVPISEKRLMSARKALPLEELTKSARLHGTDEESLKPSVNTGNTNHGYPKPNKGRAETGDAENIKSKLTTAYQPEKKHKITQPVQYAQEIMTKPVQSMNENIAFELAQEKFSKDKYRHYPVTNDNFNLVGILSDRDILRQAALNSTKSKVQQITVRDLMQRHVLTASLKATIKDVCRVMFYHHIGALPIVDEQGVMQGIITRSDLLHTMMQQGPVEFWV